MKKILNYLANKAMCAAFVVLGAASASAEELIKTPIIQTFDGVEESVGYTVSGLGEFQNEVAVVFTNHTKTANWTVPANLENVQFLVVGGGGGGGGSSGDAAGAGGGGGAVITGVVSFEENDKIDVKIGKGGTGGSKKTTANDGDGAAGTDTGATYFKVNGAACVKALWGGRDKGYNKNAGEGGSNAGNRGKKTDAQTFTLDDRDGDINTSLVKSYTSYAHKGGIGHSGSARPAAGGGGATENGGAVKQAKENGITTYTAGKGGDGFTSSITGEEKVYGSGGGGGTTVYDNNAYSYVAGKGGAGAGDGATNGNGGNGLANQGGGGGGGADGNGGNGGSGIVVFRYATNEGSVDFLSLAAKVASAVYTGETLVALSDTIAYSVSYGEYTPNAVGEYTVVVTLNDGFVWDDAAEEKSRELSVKFKIVKADDEWVAEPSITKTSWSVGDDAGELIAPTTKFNAEFNVVIAKKDDLTVTFSSLDNLDAGDYVVTWTAVGTDNYNAAEGSKTVEFTVVASDAVPPYTLSLGEISVNDDRELSIPYSLSCEATTSKMAEIIAVYTIEGTGETNEVSLATQVALNGGDFTGIIPDLKPGATYSVAIYSLVGDEKSELTEFKTVTVLGEPKNLTAEATFTTTPDKKFIVTGSVTPGIGETKVTLYYSLNSTECASTMEQVVNDDGAFAFEISYENLTDNLSWYVSAATTYDTGTWQGRFDGGNTTKVTTARKENAQSYYVWTGNGGDSLWTNPLNWTCSNNSCYGYPGVKGLYYFSWVGIETSPLAPIDLGGGLYDFIDNGAFVVGDGVTVEFYNGTLRVHGSKPMNGGSDNIIGRSNSAMIFNGVVIDNLDTLQPVAGSTIEFKGTTTQPWAYKPYTGSSLTKFIVRDGILTTGYSKVKPGAGSEVLISNAVWVVTASVYDKDNPTNRGLASITKFRDGSECQARLLLCKSATDSTDYTLTLYGTYDMKIPSNGVAKPYVVADYVNSVANFNAFVLDVTDYRKGDRIPLVYQSGASTTTDERMRNFIAEGDNLILMDNGVDVTAARNGRLVWDFDAKTLYFQQDSQNVAMIGTAEYATLGAAVEAATSGATITVLNDCTADTVCVIANKTLTIDLNGKTVKANDTAAATDGNGVFWVQAGGVLTLEDSSEAKTGTVDGNGGNDYKMAIWADGGKVVINAGNYVNENDGTHTQYDLIYAKNGGEIVINGGTFKCDTPRWTLNSNNKSPGRFVVKGGKFLGYDPSNFNTDEADVRNWCADGYVATLGEDGYYTVAEQTVKPVAPGATDVTVEGVETEEEVLSKVQLSVTVPEAFKDKIDLDTYKEYFQLKATETFTGSGVWAVEAVLKDDVKPVISIEKPAITFEDGKVTVNVDNELPGLYYGVRYATTVEGVEDAEPVAGFTVTPEEGDTAGFFRVVVDFAPIPEAE